MAKNEDRLSKLFAALSEHPQPISENVHTFTWTTSEALALAGLLSMGLQATENPLTLTILINGSEATSAALSMIAGKTFAEWNVMSSGEKAEAVQKGLEVGRLAGHQLIRLSVKVAHHVTQEQVDRFLAGDLEALPE